MKGLVTVASGEVCQMLFTGELPEVGAYYFLEKQYNGTSAQNKAFHALVMEYFMSGMHSYNSDSYEDFRNQIKKTLGAGFESYVYIDIFDDHYKMFDAKTIDEIPAHIKDDPYMKDMIRGKLKSWSRYTKKQRKDTLDNLISEMLQAGVNTNKFNEIMEGMEA